VSFVWTPGQIEVPVHVNEAASTFILDTGSEYSIVSSRLASRLKLPTERTRGRDFADDVRLKVGDIALEHQRVMVMPFDTYYAKGRNIDGLLGYDVFARFVVTIDFTGRALRLWPPTAYKPPKAAIKVPLEFSGRLPVVSSTITLPDRRTLRARLMVDTGASQAVILRYPFANENGLFETVGNVDAKTSSAPSLASGELKLVEIPAVDVSVAKWTFDRPLVQAHREPTGSGAYTDTDGVIGNTLLSRFRMTVDYPHKRLLLEPAPKGAR
jgi:Aspartyl protease